MGSKSSSPGSAGDIALRAVGRLASGAVRTIDTMAEPLALSPAAVS